MEKRLRQLGLMQHHIDICRMPLEAEAVVLTDAGVDMFDRPIQMTPGTESHWQKMKQHAANDGIELQVVSAYRSIEYQCDIIERKLQNGIALDEILKVNAIPGYSQHHSGRALDLSTPGFEPLEEVFENSDAFAWLGEHANQHTFKLSYPRGNAEGIDYEPWHWAYQGDD
jgi:D-alanyl-D-alanine carboxypeptidase